MVDAGKTSPIVGEFAPRRFSDRNPLIGVPDAYPTQYPVGVKISGATKFVDYRAGIVSIPISHPVYVPSPDAAARPALGLGITPFMGFRVSASTTWGPAMRSPTSSGSSGGTTW